MAEIEPISIFHGDDEAATRTRHEDIIKRLESFGPDQVRIMIGQGFPTQWNPIILAWLRGDTLKAAEPNKPAPEPIEEHPAIVQPYHEPPADEPTLEPDPAPDPAPVAQEPEPPASPDGGVAEG